MPITRKEIEFFYDLISKISKCPEKLRMDCAIICAFLQNREEFDEFYIRVVDPKLKTAYKTTKSNPPIDWNSLRGGALMRAFYNLMNKHGFTTLYGVVLTGSAEGFGAVLANKVLFKDLTGPMHGEFTHSLQWLSICILQECECNGVIEGNYQFQNRIADIYGKVGGFFIRRYIDGQGEPESSWPGEIRFKTLTAYDNAPKYLWDMMVDCFATLNPRSEPIATEDPFTNLYTNSYRCPANITISIQQGSLCNTFIAKYWRKRREKYAAKEVGNKKWYYPNVYNPMMIAKQSENGRSQRYAHTWAIPSAFLPDKEMRNRIAVGPGWAKPDLFSPRDEWDDDPFDEEL